MDATQTTFEQAVMDAKFFGTTLKKLRQEAGLNQAELAERTGLAQGTLSLLENGERQPAWETVLAICIALNVSCEDFRPPPAKQPHPRPRRPGRDRDRGEV